MKQIKVSETTPIQLNWLAAKCESSDGRLVKLGGGWNGSFYAERENGPDSGGFHRFDPTADWSQGGPIIEREKIGLWSGFGPDDNQWGANKQGIPYEHCGPTPLIAAMRCFVASKLGAEVEIPEELLE